MAASTANDILRKESNIRRHGFRRRSSVPNFVANAGGLIRLAGLYLGYTEAQLDTKVEQIEQTTLAVFEESKSQPSTSAAAIAYAKRKIAAGPVKKPAMAGAR